MRMLVFVFLFGCGGTAPPGVPDADVDSASDAVSDAGSCSFVPVTLPLPFAFQKATDGNVTYYAYAPPSPKGLIVPLHGTYGSSQSVTEVKVEFLAFHAAAVARGYALLVSESDLRTPPRQWSSDLLNNVDVARFQKLIDGMRTSGAITTSTPIYFMGMSQGGGVAPIFATMLENKGYPVKAVASYCAGSPNVYASSSYSLPATFQLMEADAIVDFSGPKMSYDTLKSRMIDTDLFVKPKEKLCAARFARIAGISESDSKTIFDALVASGVLASDGTVLVMRSENIPDMPLPGLPSRYAMYEKQIVEQLLVVGAQHQMYGDRNAATLDFFAAHP